MSLSYPFREPLHLILILFDHTWFPSCCAEQAAQAKTQAAAELRVIGSPTLRGYFIPTDTDNLSETYSFYLQKTSTSGQFQMVHWKKWGHFIDD